MGRDRLHDRRWLKSPPGSHKLTIKITGANAGAVKADVTGLDCVTLEPAQ